MQKKLCDDTLEIAYKILYMLEHNPRKEFAGTFLSPEKLGADPSKWLQVIQTLDEEGYISGVRIWENICGDTQVDLEYIRITLSGAQYLKENNAMAKFAKAATNIITIVKP